MQEYPIDINSFIGGWYINTELCDGLIDVFNKYKDFQEPGSLGRENSFVVDKSSKDSTDLVINSNPDIIEVQDYYKSLSECAKLYEERYDLKTRLDRWGITSNPIIQKYEPGGGYHLWHYERGGANPNVSFRVLAWMTYLNDVTDGGETEWLYQKIKIKPQKGLTVIWPTDWTHIHRGVTSLTQQKYIFTGWYSFY